MTAVDATITAPEAGGPSQKTRLGGLMGILGGAVLLAAFVLEIPPGLNTVRLVLFNLGAIAVGAATAEALVAAAGRAGRVAVLAVIVTNAWYLTTVVASSALSIPIGAGTFGLAAFGAGLAMWLSDALFGVVAMRLGGWSRIGAAALAVGSLLAILGMDRLGLTSSANATIYGALALIGIALNGLGWIVLGIRLAIGQRA